MSSYIMHIGISDVVKKRLGLTDKFVFGGILPDLLKSVKQDRDSTHYIETIIVDGERRSLPNIQKAIRELDFEDNEIKLGYIAHLVEDWIWFNNYIPTYASVENDGWVKYLNDGTMHKASEFSKDIYTDYTNSNKYVVEKCDVDIQTTINNMVEISNNNIDMQPLLQNSVFPENIDVNNNKLITKESIDEYIEVCAREVEKITRDLIGE